MVAFRRRVLEVVVVMAGLVGCKDLGNNPPVDAGQPVANQGSEWVNYQTEVPLSIAELDTLMSGMFGPAAESGAFITNKEVAKAFFVTSEREPATPDQVRLTFSFDDGSQRRVLAATPASLALGKLFKTTVDAAIAKMQTDVAAHEWAGESFHLSYSVTSTQGGTLTLTANGTDGVYSLSLDVTSPHTTLATGQVGLAARPDAPYAVLSGTVWFEMHKDEFDYFTDHAYGAGAASGQNFTDFALVPYEWLRLTVTPQLDQKFVTVSFAVVGPDNSRIQFAKAPASIMAGSTFQHLVDRQMLNMMAQEKAQPGSSTPWSVPFYYDQPEGGGVVQVIVKGEKGKYRVAYSVASPQHALVDVPFVPHQDVTIPPPDPMATTPCHLLGNPNIVQSRTGVFEATFKASQVIKNNLMPGQQLKGDIGCSVFRASDVTVTGPVANAVAMEDFVVPMADLLISEAPKFTTKTQLPNGMYQILCAQYVDGNTTRVSKGDPVTLPIGPVAMACNVNPVVVEFAILNPSDR
jgi:hypothetical protein